MKILAVDTSSAACTAALVCDNILVAEHVTNNKLTHSQKLMPMIENLLSSVEVDITDIDAFAVSSGPGSFTGLRIGIAAVKGLAHACKKKVVCVSTLEAMAYNIPFCDKLVVPMLDARRDQVYSGIYYSEDYEIKTHTEPCADSIDAILNIVKNSGKEAVFLGDGAIRFEKYIKDNLGAKAYFVPANLNMQKASSVAVLAQKRINEAVECGDVCVTYLRKSQAEREYDEKNKNI